MVHSSEQDSIRPFRTTLVRQLFLPASGRTLSLKNRGKHREFLKPRVRYQLRKYARGTEQNKAIQNRPDGQVDILLEGKVLARLIHVC